MQRVRRATRMLEFCGAADRVFMHSETAEWGISLGTILFLVVCAWRNRRAGYGRNGLAKRGETQPAVRTRTFTDDRHADQLVLLDLALRNTGASETVGRTRIFP